MHKRSNIAKDTSTRFHPELDFDLLRAVHEDLFAFYEKNLDRDLPEDEDREECYAEIVSYRDQEIATIGRLESRQHPQPDSVPTDVFIMMYGEPPDRSMTKVGGVPYWPAERPWPTNWRGKPLRFLAQVNFTDSRDLFDSLPNDVLLLFEGSFGSHEVWLPAGISDLIAPDDVPKTQRHYFPTYGVVYRSYDPPKSARHERSPLCDRLSDCVKVGGNPWAKKARFPSDGALLFQLHGLDEITKEWEEKSSDCGDGGCDSDTTTFFWSSRAHPPLSIFLMPDGKIRYVYDRFLEVYETTDNAGSLFVTVSNKDTEASRAYEINWRWPFIHRE